MNFNKAFILGNVTRDPELRTTPSGQAVCSFGVATNRVWKSQAGERQRSAEFHNVVAWGKLGELCSQYLTKGRPVLVEGRIQTRSWDAPDGQKRNATEVVALNIQFLRQGQGQGARGPAAPSLEEAPAGACL